MRYILFYFLILFSMSSQAALIPTSISVINAGDRVVPTITWSSIGGTLSSGDLTQYGGKMRYFGVATRVTSFANGNPYPQDSYISMFSGQNVTLAPGDTWQQAVDKYTARFGASGSYTYLNGLSSVYNYEACFAASTCYNCGNQAPDNIIYPGSCISVPMVPVTNVCNITGNIIIDHGTLLATEVNGHEATTSAIITCQQSALVKLRVYDQRTNLGNGIYSDLYINGNSSVEGPYSVAGAGLTLNITSKLVSTNPQAGTFSGSKVVVVDIM
ncbi:hypothetical protein [Aeromonas sp. s10]|uniref:MrpH family fimbial adhesin n=1 Tax=Aeromonas TaxID=642 RepID=UPI0034A3947D